MRMTLTQRAVLVRRIAADHRVLADNILQTAVRLEWEAWQMEQGIDPHVDSDGVYRP